MEKYYCEKCRLLYEYNGCCVTCGEHQLRKIWIEVQHQEKK